MLTLFRKPTTKHHVNPKFRAFGRARIDIAQRASSPDDWEKLWKKPRNSFPFKWGEHWRQSVEYKVDDFAAEVGFYVDILGFPVNAFDPDYAMFTSPNGDFYISVIPTPEGSKSTPGDAIRIQFMVEDLMQTASELERRGVVFDQWPQACAPGSKLFIGYFRTPHGICVDLWGKVDLPKIKDPEILVAKEEQEDIGLEFISPSVEVKSELVEGEEDQGELSENVGDFQTESEEEAEEEYDPGEYEYVYDDNL